MDFLRIFEVVEGEYTKSIACGILAAMTINLTTRVRKSDYKNPGRFTERLYKKTKGLLYEYSDDDIELIIKIRDSWNEYQLCQDMAGLGGCKKKTLKEIIENKG
ncbi:hypothetical protein M0R04_04695 [Candidatus Dojkabacteria bacterium]|jgi:hypothetical protein|nr:hypothetical protein [Candidatus Dojkabacteria bacterium]